MSVVLVLLLLPKILPCFSYQIVFDISHIKLFLTLSVSNVIFFCALDDGEVSGPYISEEKVMFGVFAHAMSQMTIAKIRKIYNKVDSKSIAKQVSVWLSVLCVAGNVMYKNVAFHSKGRAGKCLWYSILCVTGNVM